MSYLVLFVGVMVDVGAKFLIKSHFNIYHKVMLLVVAVVVVGVVSIEEHCQ